MLHWQEAQKNWGMVIHSDLDTVRLFMALGDCTKFRYQYNMLCTYSEKSHVFRVEENLKPVQTKAVTSSSLQPISTATQTSPQGSQVVDHYYFNYQAS